MKASWYLIYDQGDGHILDGSGLPDILEYFTYFKELLESPERSGNYSFDQQRYTTAAKECLQLYLCNHHKFSKGTTEHDLALYRNIGIAPPCSCNGHSHETQGDYCPKGSFKHKSCLLLSYRWALDLLPFFLEKSAISLELAELLHGCTFTTMSSLFPQRKKLAKKAIVRYLLWVDSVQSDL
jgi:hypothetical protein